MQNNEPHAAGTAGRTHRDGNENVQSGPTEGLEDLNVTRPAPPIDQPAGNAPRPDPAGLENLSVTQPGPIDTPKSGGKDSAA